MNLVDNYQLLNNNGIIVLEYRSDKLDNISDNYNLLKCKKYGDKFISIYKFKKNN